MLTDRLPRKQAFELATKCWQAELPLDFESIKIVRLQIEPSAKRKANVAQLGSASDASRASSPGTARLCPDCGASKASPAPWQDSPPADGKPDRPLASKPHLSCRACTMGPMSSKEERPDQPWKNLITALKYSTKGLWQKQECNPA